MSYAPLGPKKPKKKPKPKSIEFINDDVAFIDGDFELVSGVEIYVCIDEDASDFAPLQSGSYTLENGVVITVTDGIVN
jgi:hypothetical protein